MTGIPLAWDAIVTLDASYQKVFSSNPKIGFFEQRSTFQAAIDDGKVLPPAKNMDQMHEVVTNSTVDGVLAALFAVMIIIVLLDSARIWWKVIVSKRRLETTEVPFVESTLWAPAGLIPTAEERDVHGDQRTRDDGSVDTDREPVGTGGARMTVKEAFAGVRWYLREVTGESAYDRYVEHVRRDHPDAIVMSRRDFERMRMDDRDANPRARCC